MLNLIYLQRLPDTAEPPEKGVAVHSEKTLSL